MRSAAGSPLPEASATANATRPPGRGRKVEAITAEGAHLPASGTVPESLGFRVRDFHESFLQVAGYRPVLADIHYHRFRHHLSTSVSMSARAA